MSAVITPTRRSLACRLWTRLRCAYLRYRIVTAEADIEYLKEDIANADQQMAGEYDYAEFVSEKFEQIKVDEIFITSLQRRIRLLECA